MRKILILQITIILIICLNTSYISACFNAPKQSYHYFKFIIGKDGCPNFNNVTVKIEQYDYSHASNLKKSVLNGIKVSGRSVNDQDIKIAKQNASSLAFQKKHNLAMYRITFYCNGTSRTVLNYFLLYSDLNEQTSTFYIEVPDFCCVIV